MTAYSSPVTSTLLFRDGLDSGVNAVLVEIRQCLARNGLRPAPVDWLGTSGFRLICDTVVIAVAMDDAPLALNDLYERASRVGADAADLRWLRDHEATITIIVADRKGSPATLTAERKATLSDDLTACFVSGTGADMVISEAAFLIATGEDFLSECLASALPVQRQGNGIASLLDADDVPSNRPVCSAWERVSRGYAPEPEEPDFFDAPLSPERVSAGTSYGLLALLGALSLPTAIAALVYQLFRGRDSHRLAQLVIVAGLFSSLELASIWSFEEFLTGKDI